MWNEFSVLIVCILNFDIFAHLCNPALHQDTEEYIYHRQLPQSLANSNVQFFPDRNCHSVRTPSLSLIKWSFHLNVRLYTCSAVHSPGWIIRNLLIYNFENRGPTKAWELQYPKRTHHWVTPKNITNIKHRPSPQPPGQATSHTIPSGSLQVHLPH